MVDVRCKSAPWLISSFCRVIPCRRMGLDNLWKPDLRGRIEQGISRIAAGLVTKDTVSTAQQGRHQPSQCSV